MCTSETKQTTILEFLCGMIKVNSDEEGVLIVLSNIFSRTQNPNV